VHVYGDGMSPAGRAFCASLTLAGVVIGQLYFGTFADLLGRKAASLTTAMLTVVGAILSACVIDTPGFRIAYQLGMYRFFLGLGIGGEYPLSASLSKEIGNDEQLCVTRLQVVAVNIAMFSVGSLLQSLLVLSLVLAEVQLKYIWRIALAFGLVPSLIAFALRYRMEETSQQPTGEHPVLHSYLASIRSVVGPKWVILVGACLCWFLFNITSYGQGSFSAIIYDRVFGTQVQTPSLLIQRDAVFALILNLFALLGTVMGIVIIHKVSIRRIQMVAFLAMAATMWLFCGLLGSISSKLLAFMLLLNFIWSFTVGFVAITTYVIPTWSFPTSARATVVGLASAAGKVGAVLGAALFPICEAKFGLKIVLAASGFVSFIGVLVTIMLTPDMVELLAVDTVADIGEATSSSSTLAEAQAPLEAQQAGDKTCENPQSA